MKAYQLEVVVRNAQMALGGNIRERVGKLVKEFFRGKNCTLSQIVVYSDRFIIIFETPDNADASNFVRQLKEQTGRQMEKEFPAIVKKYTLCPSFWGGSRLSSSSALHKLDGRSGRAIHID